MDELDDLFDEELEVTPSIVEKDIFTPTPKGETSVDDIFEDVQPSLVTELLKSKGINDSKITILDENEESIEVGFNTLTLEEQLEILTSEPEKVEVPNSKEDISGLDGTDAEFFNKLKTDNISVLEYLESYKESILNGVETPENIPSYDIDSYDDKELYLLDLKAKYDLTNEELQSELERALDNEELFNKKVEKTREEYKKLEDQHKADQQANFELEQKKEYETYSNTMVDTAINTSEYYGITIEDSEKNEVLGDLLELDESGVSTFYKTIAEPDKLFEAAWFMRYGKDAFNALQNAYDGEIARLKQDNKQNKKPDVVIKKKENDTVKSIFDLEF